MIQTEESCEMVFMTVAALVLADVQMIELVVVNEKGVKNRGCGNASIIRYQL